jgi:hypothetical protein
MVEFTVAAAVVTAEVAPASISSASSELGCVKTEETIAAGAFGVGLVVLLLDDV